MDLVREAEVRDLHAPKVVHEAVPGSQISVNEFPLGQVDHAGADLLRDRDLVEEEVHPALKQVV